MSATKKSPPSTALGKTPVSARFTMSNLEQFTASQVSSAASISGSELTEPFANASGWKTT